MRDHSSRLDLMLRDSFGARLIVDVYHGSNRVFSNLPVSSWSFSGVLDSDVKHTGSVTVDYQSVSGESLLPSDTADLLSPYRARLLFLMEIASGAGSETVTLGWGRVTAVPQGYDTYDGNGNTIVSHVVLEWASLDLLLQRRGFRWPEQIPDTSSCYKELRRISRMNVTETVVDAPIPSAVVYEARPGGRLDGVQMLAGVLGGTAVVNSWGALTIVPDTMGSVDGVLALGATGTVVDVSPGLDTDGVYNTVVGSFEAPNRRPITAVARATETDLNPSGYYGEYTKYVTSDTVTTQSQANLFVAAELKKSLRSQADTVQVKCVVNPLIELGDVVQVTGWYRSLTGRVVSYDLSDAALMSVTLEVPRVYS